MQNVLKNQRPIVIAALLVASVTAVAWQNKTSRPSKINSDTVIAAGGDTTQPRKRNIDKDEFGLDKLDAALRDLDKDMKRLGEEMKNLKLDNIDKEIKASMANVDFEKMNRELKASLRNLDVSMKEVELSKLKAELSDKVRVEMKNSLREAEIEMKKIDLSKIKTEMKAMQDKLQSENFNIKIDGEKIRKSVEEGMAKAKEGMEKARVEMKNLREFTDALEKDGLINKEKGYKVQLKEGSLYINGKEQSKETTKKYKQYYKEKKNFTINMDGENSINL